MKPLKFKQICLTSIILLSTMANVQAKPVNSLTIDDKKHCTYGEYTQCFAEHHYPRGRQVKLVNPHPPQYKDNKWSIRISVARDYELIIQASGKKSRDSARAILVCGSDEWVWDDDDELQFGTVVTCK